jgi:hypothetical protein
MTEITALSDLNHALTTLLDAAKVQAFAAGVNRLLDTLDLESFGVASDAVRISESAFELTSAVASATAEALPGGADTVQITRLRDYLDTACEDASAAQRDDAPAIDSAAWHDSARANLEMAAGIVRELIKAEEA